MVQEWCFVFNPEWGRCVLVASKLPGLPAFACQPTSDGSCPFPPPQVQLSHPTPPAVLPASTPAAWPLHCWVTLWLCTWMSPPRAWTPSAAATCGTSSVRPASRARQADAGQADARQADARQADKQRHCRPALYPTLYIMNHLKNSSGRLLLACCFWWRQRWTRL